MELLHQLLGTQKAEVWIAGFLWSFMGIVAVKLYFYSSKLKFNLKYWLNDNSIDIIKGLFWSLVILRLGDYVVHLAKDKFQWAIPETTDFVIIMIVISGAIQYKLHKSRKPISKQLEQEMHIHNENCNHETH